MTTKQSEQNILPQGLLAPHLTGFISIKGEDAAKFLQGQFTCDVQKIQNEQLFSLGAYCNIKGKVQALFRIFWAFDRFFLWLPQEQVATTIILLKKYAVFSKVQIEDTSNQYTLLGCNHPDTITRYWAPHLSTKVQLYGETVALLPIHAITQNQSSSTQIQTLGFFTETPQAESLKSKLFQAHPELNQTLQSTHVMHQLDILHQIPLITKDTQDQFLVHSLNLPNLGGVSFDKGCYLGQEIIARMHYKGQSKQSLYLVTIQSQTAPVIGEDILNPEGQELEAPGKVIDCCPTLRDQYQALICLRISNAEHLSVLRLKDCQGHILA